MQNAEGLSVRWLEPAELDELNPTMAPRRTLGGTFCAEDGYLTRRATSPPTRWRSPPAACRSAKHVTFTGLSTESDRVTGVQTSAGRSPPRSWC